MFSCSMNSLLHSNYVLGSAPQELAKLQGIGGTEWSHYDMHLAPDKVMRSFIGNAYLPKLVCPAWMGKG